MICVSIQEQDFVRCKEILAGCQMAELRGDLCNFTTAQTEELVRDFPNLLYTHRIFNSTLTRAKEQIIAAIKKGVKYVDVEIEAPVDFLEEIKSYARVNGCTLVISYHNFTDTQSLEELETIYSICRRKGADIVKIVTTAHTVADAARVMELYRNNKSDADLVPDNFMERGEESGSLSNSFGENQAKLVAFCMGAAGKFTRHLSLLLGAPYTYVAIDKNSCTAPGQYTKEEMEKLLCSSNYPYTTFRREETIFGETPQLNIPCSKSIAQRAILAAALAEGVTVLENFEPCNDISGAVEVIKKLGAEVNIKGTTLTIKGKGAKALCNTNTIFTGESGLLTRLLIPLAAYMAQNSGKEVTICGEGSILKRNLGESIAAINAAGAYCTTNNGHLPFTVGIQPGKKEAKLNNNIEFSGKESSQIVSGFLMMLPLLKEDSTLTITNPASLPYIELTLNTLEKFGITVEREENLPERVCYVIKGNQSYTPASLYLDSDWSSAANFAVAGALTNGVTLRSMPVGSSQADEFVLDLLKMFGHKVETKLSGLHGKENLYDVTIHPAGNCDEECAEREISLHHSPDLFPLAALLACCSKGKTALEGVERLSQKESNRAETVYSSLTKMGYRISIVGNKMYICGSGTGSDAESKEILVNSHNDHRIAMCAYIASLVGNRTIKLDNIKCIDKSFPSFVERLKK